MRKILSGNAMKVSAKGDTSLGIDQLSPLPGPHNSRRRLGRLPGLLGVTQPSGEAATRLQGRIENA